MTLKEDVNTARDRWRQAEKDLHESRAEIERLTKELRETQADIEDAKQGGDRREKLRAKEERQKEKLKQEEREKKALKEMVERRDKVRDELVAKLKKRQEGSKKPSGNWTASGPDTWGGCRAVIDNEVLPVYQKYGVPITSRKRTETYGNPTSDHHVSQVNADAVDGGVATAYGIQDKVGESVGVGDMQDYVNEYFTYEGVRFRIQTIAGTHGTGPHLHTGIRRA